jgi:hypothetical protein
MARTALRRLLEPRIGDHLVLAPGLRPMPQVPPQAPTLQPRSPAIPTGEKGKADVTTYDNNSPEYDAKMARVISHIFSVFVDEKLTTEEATRILIAGFLSCWSGLDEQDQDIACKVLYDGLVHHRPRMQFNSHPRRPSGRRPPVGRR